MRLRGSWGWKGPAIRKKVPKDSLEGSIWKKNTKKLLRIFYAKPPSCFLLPSLPHYRPLQSQKPEHLLTQARPSHSFLSQKSFVWPQGPGHRGPHRCCCADLPPSTILPPPTTPLQLEIWALLSCLLQVFPSTLFKVPTHVRMSKPTSSHTPALFYSTICSLHYFLL